MLRNIPEERISTTNKLGHVPLLSHAACMMYLCGSVAFQTLLVFLRLLMINLEELRVLIVRWFVLLLEVLISACI
jgi:hypothetical protein